MDFIRGLYDYSAYGRVTRQFVAGGIRHRFKSTAHERDLETGYDYRGARWSDPGLGRFLSVDPLAWDAPSWSPFNAMWNNPIKYIDPDGKWAGEPGGGNPYGTQNPMNTISREFQKYFQAAGRLADNVGARIEGYFSFGKDISGTSGAIKGNISNETRTTLQLGTSLEDYFTPTHDNKPSGSPLMFDVKTTNETKVSVSGKVTLEGLDFHANNVTSMNNATGEVKNTTTMTIGKGQTGAYVEAGPSGIRGGVKTEHKVSTTGDFIKFGLKFSVGND